MADSDNNAIRPLRTLRQELGRYDPDLTPAHDGAMFWLDEWVRQHMLDRHTAGRPELHHILGIDSELISCCSSVEQLENRVGESCPDCEAGTLDSIEWERPLREETLFLDLVATVSQSLPKILKGWQDTGPEIISRSGAVTRARARVWKWGDVERQTWHYGFEVKPKLFSIGATLRQLKVYGRWFNGQICLVAPSNPNYERIIRREGFGYLTCHPALSRNNFAHPFH